ncbi:MAG: acetate uptake transporter family protein [Acidimicrobiales bacterium]
MATPQNAGDNAPVAPVARQPGRSDESGDRAVWEGRTRVFLTPYAPPSIIGLYGFMGATLMVGAWQAGWYGNAATGFILFPFAAIFGGIMQGGAAFPSLRARDGLAAGIHATWGAFWIGFGILFGLGAVGLVPIAKFGTVSTPFAFWFIVLALITGAGALVASLINWSVFGVLLFLTLGSGFTAAGWWSGGDTWLVVGGWLFVVSAAIAWYTATAMVAENMTGKALLPLGAHSPSKKQLPPMRPIEYPAGMPGVKVGQ